MLERGLLFDNQQIILQFSVIENSVISNNVAHKIEMTDKIVDSNGRWLTNPEVNGDSI